MAAALLVPFVSAGAWPDAIGTLRTAGFNVVALTPDPLASPLSASSSTARTAVLVGAEGDGLSPAALDAATIRVRIPMTPRVDSLNVTTAASIAMYQLFGEPSESR